MVKKITIMSCLEFYKKADKSPYWRVSLKDGDRVYDALCFDPRITTTALPHKGEFDIAEKDDVTFLNFSTPKPFFPELFPELKVQLIIASLEQATLVASRQEQPTMESITEIQNYLYNRALEMFATEVDLSVIKANMKKVDVKNWRLL